ncbi:MAG: ATPase, T2SS/T4P/T4SS family [Planctomycetota bacterium]
MVALDLEKIGLTDKPLAHVRQLIDLPHGIVLVTGPTGSGKTTTLYSMLNEANDVGIKIITTEDPVEYDLEGIVQIPINDEIGVTYARVLRTILRQDPDMILVGEIRDLETAKIAVEAALTGHLVFSTLHTNDAPSAAACWLVDLGVEPYLLTSTLVAVVAQRLVRGTTGERLEAYAPGPEVIYQLGLKPELVRPRQGIRALVEDVTCNCLRIPRAGGAVRDHAGQDRLKNGILEGASTTQPHEIAVEDGMTTLRDSGLRLIFDRVTSVEEVVRETIVEV